MIEKIEFDNSTSENLINEQPQVDNIQPEDEGLDLTADEILEIAADLAASYRCKDPYYAEQFKARYISINKLVLTIVGFNKALRSVSIQSLPPEYALVLGFGVMIGTAFFLPTGEPKSPPKKQPAPSGANRPPKKKEEPKPQVLTEPKGDEVSKESKPTEQDKISEVSSEEMDKFLSILNEEGDKS